MLYIMCHVSCGIGHMSHVMCHVSCVTNFLYDKFTSLVNFFFKINYDHMLPCGGGVIYFFNFFIYFSPKSPLVPAAETAAGRGKKKC